jgi:hypothetical protein
MADTPFFQAVGIIRGDVTIPSDQGKSLTVSIQGQQYPLLYIPSRQGFKAVEALKKEVAATGKSQRLIVYPKITHFPGRDKPHSMAFQLVGFDRGKGAGVTSDLADFEFKISGLWQFIPVCPTPCVSVFRNFSDSRLEFIKKARIHTRVKFMKGSHIPILWKNAPTKPFRFNPKTEKQSQGKPVFVCVKAKLLVSRQMFGFDSLLSLPQEEAPKFFKASKKMKAEALREADANGSGAKKPNTVKSPQAEKVDSKPAPKPLPKPRKKEATV